MSKSLRINNDTKSEIIQGFIRQLIQIDKKVPRNAKGRDVLLRKETIQTVDNMIDLVLNHVVIVDKDEEKKEEEQEEVEE
jgi:hypothetical protein